MSYCELRIAPRDFPDPELPMAPERDRGEVVLGGGCFWCVEAVFKRLEGVREVTSGYAGGGAESANYRSVCSGTTGHAEVIRVRYDPAVIGFGDLLKVFFSTAHDPTQRDRQGNDRGTQYRSVVFFGDDDQRRVAAAYIRQLDTGGVYSEPIATTLEPLDAFHEAETYHQDYAERNPDQPYIAHVARPKVQTLVEQFPERLKSDRS